MTKPQAADMPGLKVAVYFNLHRKVFSVKALEGPHKGKVACHLSTLVLAGPITFKISEAGRRRVVREKKKNVHAFVVGRLAEWVDADGADLRRISYNPYRGPSFYDVDQGYTVETADLATFNVHDGKAYVCVANRT